MQCNTWLTADILPSVAAMLDFKSFARVMATCKLVHQTLALHQTAMLYPHAVRHIARLIVGKRRDIKDEEYKLERTVGNVMIYATEIVRTRRLKSYFTHIINDLDKNKPATVIIIVNRRIFIRTAPGEMQNSQLDTVKVNVVPSLEHPLMSGTIEVKHFRSDKEEEKNTTTIYYYYSKGFKEEILHELVCNICAMKAAALD